MNTLSIVPNRGIARCSRTNSTNSLEMIRDFFGHVDVKTTQIYARAHLERKRNALESMGDSPPLPTIPSWQQNQTLLEWLRSL
jgi:integrase/recombinase XerD